MADAGLKLKVEGEAEFKKALKEVNDELKVNQSELKLLAEQYKVNNQDINTLSERQKAYGERLETTKEKVSLIKDEIAKASEVYGENSSVVQNLTIKYNNARAEVVKLTAEYEKAEKEVENVTNATADYNSTMESLSDAYKTIEDPIEANTKAIEILNKAVEDATEKYGENTDILEKYQGEIKKSEKAVEKYREKVDEINKEDGGWGGTIGAVDDILKKLGVDMPLSLGEVAAGFGGVTAAVGLVAKGIGIAIDKQKELNKTIQETAESTADMKQSADALGITTQQYQQLEFYAEKTNIKTSDLTKTYEEFSKQVRESDDIFGDYIGNSEAFAAADFETQKMLNEERRKWDEVGISLYDANGNLRDTIDLYLELIKVLQDMENITKRNSIAEKFFGSSYNKINPLLNTSKYEMSRIDQEMYSSGVIKSDLEIASNLRIAETKKKKEEKKELQDRVRALEKDANNLLWSFQWDEAWKVEQEIYRLEELIDQYTRQGYAAGTTFYPGGFSLVGEYGPEIVSLPRGSRIYPNGVTPNIPAGTSSNVYNITIDAKSVKEFNDIVELAQSARVRRRMN